MRHMRLVGFMTGVGSNRSMRTFQRVCTVGQRACVRGLRVCVLGLAVTAGACTGGGQGGLSTSGANAQDAELDATARTLWASGVEAENAHNYELAINSFGNLYERRPDDAKVFAAFLRNMRYGGRAADAVRYADQRARHLLDDAVVKFEYAKAQVAAGRKDDALNTLRAVVVLMPDNWQVHSALGIAFDATGQFDNAIAAYKMALKLSPENAVVMNNLAMSQAMAGQLQAAIGTLEVAAAINRTNTHIRQNLALLYAANGEHEKARALAAMDLDSGDLETNLSFYRRFGGGGLP